MLKTARRSILTPAVLIGFICAGVSALQGCATTTEAPPPSTVEINKGKLVPDAPGEAGETAPKPDQPGADPSKPAAATATDSGKAPAKPTNEAASWTPKEMIISYDWVNVRGGPGMKFEVVRKIKKGTKVNVSAKENGIWGKIGEKEYVADKFLGNQ